jgi:hypothetical protein
MLDPPCSLSIGIHSVQGRPIREKTVLSSIREAINTLRQTSSIQVPMVEMLRVVPFATMPADEVC